jgi:hypothetical protein
MVPLLSAQFLSHFLARALPRWNRDCVREHRHVVDPQADKIDAEYDLPEGVLPEQDKKTKRCREDSSTGELGNNHAATEESDVNGGEFSEVDRHGASSPVFRIIALQLIH